MNNEEKENQCSGTNNKPETKSKKKAKKKKKKGRANNLSKSQKDVSHFCLGKSFLDYLLREYNFGASKKYFVRPVKVFLLKYNFVETPRKFIFTKLSICKLGSSSVLIIMRLI